MAAPDAPPTDDLRSVHTNTLPVALERTASTLLVTTYQAGKLIIVRADGGVANTHFRNFRVPMGLAWDGLRLAVGTRHGVEEFHNQPAVAPRVEPKGRHDGCLLPRATHTTGHIAIHEMGYADDGVLWAVNTRFSCLCTFDPMSSFVPRWRPAFVSALLPEDRCHLNGMAIVGSQPKYVTALGTADTPGGWRERKADGGVLMDVPSGEFICRGLSMPHSPRWYQGKLWVLESGRGTLSTVDLSTGRLTHVAQMPGFTRGLDFYGNLAFVGLSQVRESAVFSGIPITVSMTEEERRCGVWVVDILSGETVAFLRFEAGVREVFAVQLLPMRYPDLINEPDDPLIDESFILPDAALADVPGHA